MKVRGARVLAVLVILSILTSIAFTSCNSVPDDPEPVDATPAAPAAPDATAGRKEQAGGREAESLSTVIERDIAYASPDSLQRARDLIAERRVEGSELGRAMLYAIERIYALVYGEVPADMGVSDPPPLNPLVIALEEAQAGRFPDAAKRANGDFSSLLSTFVIMAKASDAARALAVAELDRLQSAGFRSLLLPYLRGRNLEASGDLKAAKARYEDAIAMDKSFSPARVARARCLYGLGKFAEAVEELKPVYEARPGDPEAARCLARSYYALGRYLSAAPIVQDILRGAPTEDEFLLMRAHILVAGGAYGQAGPLLDAYATKHPRDPLYLYLRLVHTWKERKSGPAAIALADSALALYPEDPRILRAKAEIILATSPPGSKARVEAVAALESVLALYPRDEEALALLCAEAADGGNGTRAFAILQELLKAAPSFDDYELMVKAALGAKKTDLALKWSEKWMASDPASEEAAAAYVRALVDAGNSSAALARINDRLAGKSSPKTRSILLFYRSRLQKDAEASLSDLRASLLEDPANMDALLAMFDVSFAQRDYKKARFYLRQAQSVSPSNAAVSRRQTALDGVAGQ